VQDHATLRRILGTPTTWLLGIGVAAGSGIFRTPGDVAGALYAPWLIAAAWALGGLVALSQGLVSAELATRFPRAGGEYVYLREAYGEFVAFFFGWAYTVFVIGGSSAAIAAAFGDFGSELLWPEDVDQTRSGWLAAAAILAVTVVNALGLRVGAATQNVLTVMKIAAMLGVVVVGFVASPSVAPQVGGGSGGVAAVTLSGFLFALLAVFWSYSGSSDPVKMAEEIRDVRRAMPRALIGAAVSLTVVYVLFNLALLKVVPANQMADLRFVPGEMMARVFGPAGRTTMLAVAMLVCLAALSSAVLATIRVTYALARDGLAFRIMSRMSAAQAPVPALIFVGAFAIALVLIRSFEQIVGIYYFASAILFGLAYASLIVFRRREPALPPHVFRCPLGPLQSVLLIAIYLALAVNVACNSPRDVLGALAMFALVAALYLAWKRRPPHRRPMGGPTS
jgi:APA family basic amino acid/polyamine antiporter